MGVLTSMTVDRVAYDETQWPGPATLDAHLPHGTMEPSSLLLGLNRTS